MAWRFKVVKAHSECQIQGVLLQLLNTGYWLSSKTPFNAVLLDILV